MSEHPVRATRRDDWATPPELVEAIARKLDVKFALDTACQPHNSIAGVRAVCCVERGCDGLTAGWGLTLDCLRIGAPDHRDAAWCNPPYSQLRAWLDKCKREGERCHVVALIPARTCTVAFHDHVMSSACRVLLLRGRVRFVGAPSTAQFSSAVVHWMPGYQGAPQFESWNWRSDVGSTS